MSHTLVLVFNIIVSGFTHINVDKTPYLDIFVFKLSQRV